MSPDQPMGTRGRCVTALLVPEEVTRIDSEGGRWDYDPRDPRFTRARFDQRDGDPIDTR